MTGMSKQRKSWREKLLDDKGLPRVVTLEGAAAQKWKAQRMVIPAPREVDALMRKVRKGKIVTTDALRAVLAERHGVDMACPLTTGIFSWIAAHASAEAEAAGARNSTPYWRTLKTGGEINPKFPGGAEAVAEKLRAEGHPVIQRGKRWFVADFEKRMATIS
jgi:hypothetical protein